MRSLNRLCRVTYSDILRTTQGEVVLSGNTEIKVFFLHSRKFFSSDIRFMDPDGSSRTRRTFGDF